jgi:hypothetical protein
LTIALLEKLIPGVTASLSADSKKSLSSTVKYGGLSELRTYDEPLHTKVRDWAKSIQLNPTDQYELIRDALVAESVTVTLSQQQIVDLKLDVALSKLASGQAGVTVDRGANYSITSMFKPPEPVCITAESFAVILPPAAPGGGIAPVATVSSFTPLPGGQSIPKVIHAN